jgi:hypothetical protein
MKLSSSIIALGIVYLTACADPYRNLYQGAQQRDGIMNPTVKPVAPPMSYDQYEAEQKKLREKNSEKIMRVIPST